MHRADIFCHPSSAGPPIVPNAVGRVALVISELRCGGAERVVVHLAATLRGLGAAVEIICLQRAGALADEAQAAGVPVVALGSVRGYDLKAVWRLARELRRFRPAVINVHDRSSLTYVVLANQISGRRPIVFSAHGLLMHDERPRLRDRLAGKHISRLTAVSEAGAREYARVLGWRGTVEVIDNGVPFVNRSEELARGLRESLGLGRDTFVYLAAGNIKPEKGFDDLLAATAALRDRSGRRPFAVLIAGGVSDPGCHASLVALQKHLNLDGVVRPLGLRPDMRALYSIADALVLPSRKEGLPLVLLEAMSARLPVVATKVGAVPDVVRSEVDGLLVSPAEPDQLAQGMFRLLEDRALGNCLGVAARARIESRYGVERMAERYMEVYTRCTADAAQSSHANGENQTVRPSVLMLGPLPPLTGGMATVTSNLRDSDLKSLCRLETLNNGKTTPDGRSWLVGVWAQLRLLGSVVTAVRRRHVQIVHIQTCALFSFWRDIVHMIAVRLLGCRVVWHLHDGTFPRFISEGSRIKRAIIRWALRRGSATIVLSEEALAGLRAHAPKVRWHVVPNGVPVERQREPAANGQMKLLFLGNLTRRKGAYDLIGALETAAERGVRPYLFLAGGEVLPGQRDEMERRIAASSCAEQIRLLGLIHGQEKRRAIQEADCIVLPSYAEGLPMALLEGMAAGVPAIATRVGAIPALVSDGVNGFLVDTGDVKALADRICRLAGDSRLRRQMGQAARDLVEREFSLGGMAERVYRVYLEAMRRKGG